MRDATAKHWLNADGSVTGEFFSGPVHYQDSAGAWQEIDLNLAPAAKDGFAHSVVANAVKLHFAGLASGMQAVEIGGHTISFAPLGATDAPGVVDANTITYAGAWPSVDLKYTALPYGVKEELIIKSALESPVFEFTVDPAGLSPVARDDGEIVFTDPAGVPVARTPAPFLRDAAGRFSRAIGVQWKVADDGAMSISYAPDPGWLAKADYPVVLDPSLEQEFGVYLDGFQDTAGNYGSCSLDFLRGGLFIFYDEEPIVAQQYAYIKFNVYLPSEATIVNTQIEVTATSDTAREGSVELAKLGGGWLCSGWPPIDALLDTRQWLVRTDQTPHTVVFDSAQLDAAVEQWRVAGHNWGVRLRGTGDWVIPPDWQSSEYYFFKCYASEYADPAKRPKLIVNYYTCSGESPPTTPVVTDDGEATTSSTTLHAAWTASDPEVGIAEYQYAIGATQGGTDVVGWTSTSLDASVTRADLTLTAGTTYYFAVRAKNCCNQWSEIGVSDGIKCVAGHVVYVDLNAPGPTHDGSSWSTAHLTVAEGIGAAEAGEEVWVADGIYYERITLVSGVGVYGSFAGTEGVRSRLARSGATSILDGEQIAGVVTADTVTDARIDGFTITGGKDALFGGGGIRCLNSGLVIEQNVIIGNRSSWGGGGIYCDGCSAGILRNRILHNIADGGMNAGGGVYSWGSTITLASNVIAGNSAYSQGGGIYSEDSTAAIVNNTIVANGSGEGGGIYLWYGSPTLTNNIVAFNSSGIYRSGYTSTLSHNCVYGNAAYDYQGLSQGATDITDNPVFARAEYGDLHIQPDSPCVDSGDDNVAAGDLDIDGQPRQIDRPGGTAWIDIGADESDGTQWNTGPIVVRVSTEGNDANDGSSWALAKRTVQNAIDTASLRGGEVWVRTGTYTGHVELRAFVHLYGGFEGDETEREQRDWTSYIVTLDGAWNGSVVTMRAGHQWVTVDGFTIRHGYTSVYGGGLQSSHCSPRIRNNIVEYNTSSSFGGGVHSYNGAPLIERNTISHNEAGYEGGGLSCVACEPVVNANRFESNIADDHGGAITLEVCPDALIVNNLFVGNEARWTTGGGAVNALQSNPRIVNNTFVANRAINDGHGGAALVRGDPYYSYTAMFVNNIFHSNSCTLPSGNSVACTEYGSADVRFCDAFSQSGNSDYFHYEGLAPGTGCIHADPLFVDTTDYHLRMVLPDQVSPCIDTGHNPGAAPYDSIPVIDYDGLPRPVDILPDTDVPDFGGGHNPEAYCDMGAYEHQ